MIRGCEKRGIQNSLNPLILSDSVSVPGGILNVLSVFVQLMAAVRSVKIPSE